MKRPVLSLALVMSLALWCYAETASAYYQPTVGRWIERDPSGYKEGMSLYAYVTDAPTRWTDPTGKGKVSTGDAAGAANWEPVQMPQMEPTTARQRVYKKAYFLHSEGTYYYPPGGVYVGHSAIGCASEQGPDVVFDNVGYSAYRRATVQDWLDDQARVCPKGCKFAVEAIELGISEQQANALCHRLADRNDLTWDWEGSGETDESGRKKHNCTSSLAEDMAAETPISPPDTKVPAIEGLFTNTNTPRRWGKFTMPWLKAAGFAKSSERQVLPCTGENVKPGQALPKNMVTN